VQRIGCEVPAARGAAHEETAAVWGSRSLRTTLAGTVFLLLTGVVILAASFGTGAQVCVLVHTAVGLLFLVPLGLYLVPHLKKNLSARFSHLSLLGWASGVLMLGAVGTGVWLTADAAFGTRIDEFSDLLHVVTGFAVVPVLGTHLLTAVRRNRPGEGRFVGALLGRCAIAGFALTVLCFAGGEALPAFSPRMALPADYGYRYGENPFFPSLAKTDWLARVEQDRRWIETLDRLAADPSKATPESLAGTIAAHERAVLADSECLARGETFPRELDALAVDESRVAGLRAIAAAAPESRAAEIARLQDEARVQAARNREAFDAHQGLAPEALSGSESCGTSGCHEEIAAEWRPSAHRYASRSAFFQLIQANMAQANGAESTRYCAGCHDPISLFSGSKTVFEDDLSSPGADEGLSCAVCHSIVKSDVEGNANYVLSPPVPYLDEDGFLGRFLIRAYPRHHRASYARPLLETPELCGACHKQFIDRELNRATRVQLQNQYDAWKSSPWFVPAAEAPHRADPEKTLACRDCHMRRMDSNDPASASRDGKHRHHAFIAANQWLPKYHDLPGADLQVRLTEEWLQGKTVIPEIAHLWPGGPIVPISIRAPEAVRPGRPVEIRVEVENRKVGHTFPTGPLDMIQAWIEVRATVGGKEVFRSGAIDERGFVEDEAFQLKAEGVDRAGNLIDRHNLWDMVGSRFNRSLFPGTSDSEPYRFDCPSQRLPVHGTEVAFEAPPEGSEIEVTATLRYRKVNQTLLNMLQPEGVARAPVTDMASATARIAVRGDAP
jgi:hypothetical protein